MTTTLVPPPPTSEEVPDSSAVRFLLEQQQDLTAVEKFALFHAPEPTQLWLEPRTYRDLIPLELPGKGQQFAFEVDLDACTGCKACVTACHGLNGLDETETWRDVGLLVGGSVDLPVMQHVTTACHHCVEPACMDGCPVLAYEKDPVTGIVKHLDDQCIGCQYCILKCPYEVPKYNVRLGIVRKCDMCSDRLETGEPPACVQACPTQAIRISIVDTQDVLAGAETNMHLAGLPAPQYTVPTTDYKSSRAFPRNTLAADYHVVAPEPAHKSLILMLVFMQLSVGSYAVMHVLSRTLGVAVDARFRAAHALMALAVGVAAMMASIFHLGRPLYAFRAFLGLRKSWLSREIVTFGLFMGAASARTVGHYFGVLSWLDGWIAPLGLVVVACSVMVYHDTRRAFWNARYSATRFFLSATVLGLMGTLATAHFTKSLKDWTSPGMAGWGVTLADLMIMVMVIKLLLEAIPLLHLRDRHLSPMKRTAMLMTGLLANATILRFSLGITGGILLLLLVAKGGLGSYPATVRHGAILGTVFACILAGELLERYLFFKAVVALKMPGGVGA